MTEEHSHRINTFDPTDYPALQDFLPAYLHQDFGKDYGTAAQAVNAFVSEASGDEILQVKEEWKAFRARFAGAPLEKVHAALQRLGSAWAPASDGDLQEVDTILAKAQT
jgi:CdiI immunity protein